MSAADRAPAPKRRQPRIFESARAIRAWSRAEHAAGRRVALVPTMGALHAGHRALFRAAARGAEAVAVSIFVNPAQFGPGEDFERYPRSFQQDLATCSEEGVHAVYAPPAGAVYARDHSTWVTEESLSEPMEGAIRPGHFRGVLTIVLKLFNAVEPDVAIFGQKDAQQALLIRRMARDLDLALKIQVEPTVREADGLALSSRNAHLTPDERRRAPVLWRAVRACLERLEAGESDPARVRKAGLAVLETERNGAGKGVALDYLEVVDAATLRRPDVLHGEALVAGAIRLGRTRLIDSAPFVRGRGRR